MGLPTPVFKFTFRKSPGFEMLIGRLAPKSDGARGFGNTSVSKGLAVPKREDPSLAAQHSREKLAVEWRYTGHPVRGESAGWGHWPASLANGAPQSW